MNSLVDLRDLLHGQKAPATVSWRLGARLEGLMREPVPLRSRIARFISRAFATRMPVGWILPPVAAVAILAWMILFPRSGGNLLERSPLPSPLTTELSGRPEPEAERALQSFRADVRRSTPQPSPQRQFDVPTLVSETQGAVVLFGQIGRGAEGRPRRIGSGFFVS